MVSFIEIHLPSATLCLIRVQLLSPKVLWFELTLALRPDGLTTSQLQLVENNLCALNATVFSVQRLITLACNSLRLLPTTLYRN